MTQEAKGAALITGAARRIGLRIASRLAEAGFRVALHTSPGSRGVAEDEARRLREAGASACVVVADLADVDQSGGLVDAAAAAFGPLTLLVNNAARFDSDDARTFDAATWDRHFAVNLRAPIILAQRFAAQVPAGRDAAIVNLIDQRVLRPTPTFFSYTLSKAALWTATQTLAQAFSAQGVRVNAVGPGPVLPNAIDGEAGFSKEVAAVPLKRAVDVEEICDAVLYLASARSVTGQLVAVDAGQHLASGNQA